MGEELFEIPEEKPSALILAAGRSSRMEDFKPLLPLGGLTMIEHAIPLFKKQACQTSLLWRVSRRGGKEKIYHPSCQGRRVHPPFLWFPRC